MDRQTSGFGTAVVGAVLPVLAFLVLVTSPALAQDTSQNGAEAAILATEDYLTPPQEIMDAVLAPRHENYTLNNLNPSGEWFLRTIDDGLPSLARFAKPHYNLGAWQVDPAANRDRRLTTRSDVGYELISADGSRRVTIEIPEGARVSGAEWSPDGSRLAFLAHFDDATRIYVADADDGDSHRVTPTPLLATLVTGVEWTQDGRYLIAVIPPEDRSSEPPRPEVPETPMVRITTDVENRLRTYFDLLEDPHEKRLVEYYATGQLARIEVESGDIDRIGEPGMIDGVDVSPDGQYFRIDRWDGPFSYIVPTSSVGSAEELWDLEGNVIEVLDTSELSEGARGGDDDDDDEEEEEQVERRGLSWRTDGPGMVYLQQEPREEEPDSADEEQPEEEQQERRGPRMDRVVYWLPPFDSTSTEIVYETEDRIGSVSFDATGRTLFLSRRSGNGDSARETLSAVFLDEPDEEHEVYSHRASDWREDPGSPMRTRGPNGQGVIRTSSDGGSIFLSGTRYFEDPMENAPRPFIDRVDILTGEKERVFESAEDVYERVSEVLDDDFTRLIVVRESPTMIEDSWLLNTETGAMEQLTENVDFTPDITNARRETVMVARPDGFESQVRITLPQDYQPGTRLPAMFWFYPREFTDQEDYSEGLERHNKNSFQGVGTRSMEILLRRGYAVVDPDLPIVGDNGQMNNNYVQDLRNTLTSVIDSLEQRGWIDRNRLGLGGHSYGAFGTANAMVNTAFFKAGIAGDGNYNRSLTPAGFQSERRMLWEADQIYIEMSPFFKADQLTGALLMYHGMDDHNVGTHPDHSKRLFHALNVLGKKAGLYMYPFEDHGPATRETTLDLWARWSAWLDTYVKQAGQGPKVTTEDGSAGGG